MIRDTAGQATIMTGDTDTDHFRYLSHTVIRPIMPGHLSGIITLPPGIILRCITIRRSTSGRWRGRITVTITAGTMGAAIAVITDILITTGIIIRTARDQWLMQAVGDSRVIRLHLFITAGEDTAILFPVCTMVRLPAGERRLRQQLITTGNR